MLKRHTKIPQNFLLIYKVKFEIWYNTFPSEKCGKDPEAIKKFAKLFFGEGYAKVIVEKQSLKFKSCSLSLEEGYLGEKIQTFLSGSKSYESFLTNLDAIINTVSSAGENSCKSLVTAAYENLKANINKLSSNEMILRPDDLSCLKTFCHGVKSDDVPQEYFDISQSFCKLVSSYNIEE